MKSESRWWHLAAIQIGGAVCLPIFVIGHAIASKYGLFSSLVAVVLGNLLLLCFGLAASLYAAKTRHTTSEAAASTFGSSGMKYFSAVLIFSMLGWFSIQLDLMGKIAAQSMGFDENRLFNLILGAVITLAGLHGIRGMERLANICLPLMILTIGYAVYASSKNPTTLSLDRTMNLEAMALVVTAAIGVVIDMPTFFRSAKNKSDAVYATVILFAIALPLLEGIGIFLASRGSSENLTDSLASEGSSSLWKGWVALFVILAGWTTNNANLYSAAVSLHASFKGLRESVCFLCLGTLATLCSLIDFQAHLFVFLESMGILLAAAGGVMLVHQISSSQTNKGLNRAGLFFGIAIGAAAEMGFSVTGLALIDAFASAFTVALCGCVFYKKLANTKESYEICGN